MHGQIRSSLESLDQFFRGVGRIRDMAVEPRPVNRPHVPVREAAAQRARSQKRGDIVVHPFATQPYKDRLSSGFDPGFSQHAGKKTEGVLVAHFYDVGPLLFENPTEPGTKRQRVEMRQKEAIPGVDDGRFRRFKRVNPAEFTDVLDGILWSRNDESDFPPVPIRGIEQRAIKRSNSPGRSVIAVRDVQCLNGQSDRPLGLWPG